MITSMGENKSYLSSLCETGTGILPLPLRIVAPAIKACTAIANGQMPDSGTIIEGFAACSPAPDAVEWYMKEQLLRKAGPSLPEPSAIIFQRISPELSERKTS